MGQFQGMVTGFVQGEISTHRSFRVSGCGLLQVGDLLRVPLNNFQPGGPRVEGQFLADRLRLRLLPMGLN
jgi:hypothetical protein